MNTFITFLLESFTRKKDSEITIDSRMPLPLKKVVYRDQLRILKSLGQVNPGDSFPVKRELTYAVRKMANEHHSEMKISIRKIGDSSRVFRVA